LNTIQRESQITEHWAQSTIGERVEVSIFAVAWYPFSIEEGRGQCKCRSSQEFTKSVSKQLTNVRRGLRLCEWGDCESVDV
jgi:hypothetical protein